MESINYIKDNGFFKRLENNLIQFTTGNIYDISTELSKDKNLIKYGYKAKFIKKCKEFNANDDCLGKAIIHCINSNYYFEF